MRPEDHEHLFAPGAHPAFHAIGLLLWAALTSAFWIAALGGAFWALRRFRRGRLAFAGAPRRNEALAQGEPSAAELLRRRYVTGEIDTLTFEDMLHHVLNSEQRETNARWSQPTPFVEPFVEPGATPFADERTAPGMTEPGATL